MPLTSTSETSAHTDASTRSRVRIGRVHIDPLRFEQAIDAIGELVARGAGGMVFTPNVDHIVLAEENSLFRAAYDAADLSLVDGVPVIWASRVLGRPLPQKVSGSDLIRPLMARAAERGWRVYFLGAGNGVAARAKDILELDYPGLQVVGTSSPAIDLTMDMAQQAGVIDAVRMARPHLLLLALGAPKQEVWAHRILDLVRPAVILGVGASLDFIAGVTRRAPRWVSAAGCEWLYRLANEPRRLWRRYLMRDPKFLGIVLKDAWARRPGVGP